MIKNLYLIFKIGRKLAESNIIDSFAKIYKPPLLIKILFDILGFSLKKKQNLNTQSPKENIRDSLQKMGTTFIKLGQFLATRPDIVGDELAEELSKLQDKLPEFSMIEAENQIKKELGETIFKNITNLSKPVAAASIAQVHFADINDGEIKKGVAIKILRPNIEKIFLEEINALMFLASIIESLVKKTRRLKLTRVVHLLKEITSIEMDLRFEAAAANELYENVKNDIGFKVPKIYWNYTSKKILTLDRIEAIPIREVAKIKEENIDLKKISKNLIQQYLKQAVRDGFFHADMHQGNLFVNKQGDIIAVDFGIMGRLDIANRMYLAEILYGFIKRDYKKVAEVHFAAGLVPDTTSKDEFAQALRSVGEPIFGQSIKDISGGKLLSQLFEITEKFNMETQPQLLLLQKTMVVVEGVARRLNPETNIWNDSRPVLENWLKEVSDPINKLNQTISSTSDILKKLPELPHIMEKANKLITLLAAEKTKKNNIYDSSFHENELKVKIQKNRLFSGILILVILLLLLF